jgi:hypothetical protein
MGEGEDMESNTTPLAIPAGFHISWLVLHGISRVFDKHGISTTGDTNVILQ